MDQRLLNIVERQREFQRLVGLPIDSNDEIELNRLAEIYLYKTIEEIIELRKTFPSSLYSKRQINNRLEMSIELCDVLLYLINFCIAKKINLDDVFILLEEVQSNNFRKFYEKQANETVQKLKGSSFGDRP